MASGFNATIASEDIIGVRWTYVFGVDDSDVASLNFANVGKARSKRPVLQTPFLEILWAPTMDCLGR